MSFIPSPLQTLLLWRLLANEGGDFWKRVKPREAKDRRALEAAGLIEVRKRRAEDEPRSQPSMYLSLTEQGWSWAASHLDAEFSQRSNAAGPVLHAILVKLKSHLIRSRMSLADFICPPASPRPAAAGELSGRIRQGYVQVSGGRWNVRVRLTDLRGALSDVPRGQLDAALLAMERQGSAVFYPLDDPQEIRNEDVAAGLPNSLGIRRHILCIEG